MKNKIHLSKAFPVGLPSSWIYIRRKQRTMFSFCIALSDWKSSSALYIYFIKKDTVCISFFWVRQKWNGWVLLVLNENHVQFFKCILLFPGNIVGSVSSIRIPGRSLQLSQIPKQTLLILLKLSSLFKSCFISMFSDSLTRVFLKKYTITINILGYLQEKQTSVDSVSMEMSLMKLFALHFHQL